MTAAERVLAHFDRISEAPDAIARLRRFVRDLAVRGRMVEQDSNDRPEPELLRLIQEQAGDEPELPASWRRARVGAVLDFRYGKSLKATERRDSGPVPVYGSNGVVGFTDRSLTEQSCVIVGRKGSAGALNLCDGPSWTTDVAYFVEAPAYFQLRYLEIALSVLDLGRLGKGVKPGLNRDDAYDQSLSIPPLAEQHRIVAKVDELMALCDGLEAAQKERESRRDRLVSASLARLNKPADSESLGEAARFHLQQFPRMLTAKSHVTALRETIRNLAVLGHLEKQDPRDETASTLLESIRAEKARLLHDESSQRQKGSSHAEAGASIPSGRPGWVTASLGDILVGLQTGPFGSSLHQSDYVVGGIPVVNPASLRNERIVPVPKMSVSAATVQRLSGFKLRSGDVVMARRGQMGRAAVVSPNEEGWLCGTGSLILRFHRVLPAFIVQVLGSPVVRTRLEEASVGATMQNLNQQILLNISIGLPPVAEQQRIVDKVNELMAVCDRLEAQLEVSGSAQMALVEATLREALVG